MHVLTAGSDITSTLATQIEGSDGLLAVLPRGNESSWFFAELAIALDKASRSEQYRIIPVIIHSGSKIPFVLQDRLGVNLSGGNYKDGIEDLAFALRLDNEVPVKRDHAAARAAAIDARRAFLNLAKAQHEIDKAQRNKVLAFGIFTSLTSSVVTAVPFIYLKGLSERNLWSFVVAAAILMAGVIVGRLSPGWRKARHKNGQSEVGGL